MILCKIYNLKNIINGKPYIGQTWDTFERRMHSGEGYKKCSKLYNAIQKYGEENFQYELITVCGTQETADYWEQYFIKYYNSIEEGYNLTEGGSSGKKSEETKRKMGKAQKGNKKWLGRRHTEKSKRKMSDAQKGNQKGIGNKSRTGQTWQMAEETKVKISASNKGVPKSEEHKKNLSKAKMGKKASAETNQKISETHKAKGIRPPSWEGKKHSEETKAKMRDVWKIRKVNQQQMEQK